MRLSISLLLLTSLLFSACEKENAVPSVVSDITINEVGLDFTTTYVQYNSIAPPSSSRVNLYLVTGDTEVTTTGEFSNLPADILRLNLQLPNENGALVSGVYPVSRVNPTETTFVANGSFLPNFSPSSQTAYEVEDGTVEVNVSPDKISLSLDLTVRDLAGNNGTKTVSGRTELPLVILP